MPPSSPTPRSRSPLEGQDPRHRRRVGEREIGAVPQRPSSHPVPSGIRHRRGGEVRRAGPPDPGRRRDVPGARNPDPHGVSESHDEPQSGLADRRSGNRGSARPPRLGQTRGARARHRAPPAGRHTQPRASLRGLSLPVVGRHAAARGHRHGHGRRAVAAARRRADDGAGRDHSGSDPGPAAPDSGSHGNGPRPRLPRHGRRGGDVRYRRGDVRWTDHGDRADEGSLRGAAAPLYAWIAHLDSERQRSRRPARSHPRPAAEPGGVARGCPFAPRCRFASPECAATPVELRPAGEDRRSACLFPERIDGAPS